MELYKKPVMEILELEKVDVLTCSLPGGCSLDHVHSVACSKEGDGCGCPYAPTPRE